MGTLLNRRRYMGGVPTSIDWSKQYLTFEAIESGTFKNSLNAVDYSLDGGNTWTNLAADTNSPSVSAGSKIMWKATLTPASSNGIGTFSATNKFNAMGNAMSLLYGANFEGETDLTGKTNAFRRLFYNNTKIVSAKDMVFPSLTLVGYCLYETFRGCSALVTPPELPATTLAGYCYSDTFNGCTSLATAPDLPATTVVDHCYSGMFYECKALAKAPDLPALTISNLCYQYMFYGCSKLNYIKAMFTTTPGQTSRYWVQGVAANGTFVKNSAATWTNSFGVNAIPTGWTVETASE